MSTAPQLNEAPRHKSEKSVNPRVPPAHILGAVAAAAYAVLAGISAWRRPLWFDELCTYYTGSRPTLYDVWQSLMAGAEQMPPFFYVIIRASVALFGLNELGLRLPEVAAVGVAALCVWLLVRRHASAEAAAAGTFFFLITSAYEYAYEARAYGLLLGFSGVALVCWQRVREWDRLRPLALWGLGASLVATLHTHYYGVLILGPIGAAQLVRDYRRRRLDVPVWLILTIPVASLLLLTPLVRAAAGTAATFWALPSWSGVLEFYTFLFRPKVVAVIALVALGVAASLVAFRESESGAVSFRVPVDELVAMVGLAILPFAAVALGKLITGVYVPRYVLPAAIGLSVLAGWGLAALTKGLPRVAFLAALLLLGCFIGRAAWLSNATARERQELREHSELLEDVHPDLPIAVVNPILYFKLVHYAPPDVARRMYYLADQKIALNRVGTDTAERLMIVLSQWAPPLRVADYREFTQSHSEFLVYGQAAGYQWLLPELVKDAWHVSIVKVDPSNLVLHADAKKAATISE